MFDIRSYYLYTRISTKLKTQNSFLIRIIHEAYRKKPQEKNPGFTELPREGSQEMFFPLLHDANFPLLLWLKPKALWGQPEARSSGPGFIAHIIRGRGVTCHNACLPRFCWHIDARGPAVLSQSRSTAQCNILSNRLQTTNNLRYFY